MSRSQYPAPALTCASSTIDAEPRIPRREYIKCLIELVILRGRQVEAHTELQNLKIERRTILSKSKENDPRLGKKLAALDAQISRDESAFNAIVAPFKPRIDYLSGATSIPPVHDILYPTSSSAAVPVVKDPDALVSWAERESASLREIVDQLKNELLLDAASTATITESRDGPSSSKRRKLDDTTVAASASTSPSSPPIPSVDDLTKRIAATQLSINQTLSTGVAKAEADYTALESAKLQQHQTLLTASAAPQPNVDYEVQVQRESAKQAESVRKQLEKFDEVTRVREKRNAKARETVTFLKAKVLEIEADLAEAREHLAVLSTPPSAPSPVPAPAPEVDAATIIERDLRDTAFDAIDTILSDGWKQLEASNVALNDVLTAQLWGQLGENVRTADKILAMFYGS